MLALHNAYLLQAHAFTAPQFKAQDLHGLSPAALAEVAAQRGADAARPAAAATAAGRAGSAAARVAGGFTSELGR